MLSFDGQVAVVTGSARGLGRAYAGLLAERGARVVVNDFGGELDGTGESAEPAEKAVVEIRAKGGDAVACVADIGTPEGGREVVTQALDTFGRIDMVVHNAGAGSELTRLLAIHLMGAFHVLEAAWPHLSAQNYGRIVLTTSASGLWSRPIPMSDGMPSQLGYGAAKGGLVGLMHNLAHLGEAHNINVNAIAPFGRSRMNAEFRGAGGLFGPELAEFLELAGPEQVAPVVAWLLHRDCAVTHGIFQAGGGKVTRVFIGETAGWNHRPDEIDIEAVRDHWDRIEDQAGYRTFANGYEEMMWRAEERRRINAEPAAQTPPTATGG